MDVAPLLGRTLVVVAHPDDEAVGCGGLLQRMAEPAVLFCTDGAPRDVRFWPEFASRDAYAEARAREASRALAAVRVSQFVFLAPGGRPVVDQELFQHVEEALEELLQFVRHRSPEALLTPAFEGGHPDHDACSLLAALVGREAGLPVWEMPLYHRSTDGVEERQEFLDPGDSDSILPLTPAELARKQTMWSAYRSQAEVLRTFNPQVERFRPQPAYDFARPPHPGVLNYEARQWPMTGAEVAAAFAASLALHMVATPASNPSTAA